MIDNGQQFTFAKAMQIYGGGFASTLADAYLRADMSNRARIEKAFPDLVAQYGPGSDFYKAVQES